MKTLLRITKFVVALNMCLLLSYNSHAQYFLQEFDDISGTPMIGWDTINMSNPIGVHAWFQGNTTVFSPYSGSGYLASNFHAVAVGTGTISAWLISPLTTLHNGDLISFWLRKTDSVATNYPDRLQVRFSTNGASINVGTTEVSVGDFSHLVIDINPNYSNVGWPTGFPYVWTKFNVAVSGLTGNPTGRIAFRYFVEEGGSTGSRSDYIGIDSVAFHSSGVGIDKINKQNISIFLYPNPVKNILHLEASIPMTKVKISNILGQEMEAFELNSNKTSINTSAYAPGIYYVSIETHNGTISRKITVQ